VLFRSDKSLVCVSNDDLLAPYCAEQRQRHEDLRALLGTAYGIELAFEDFLSSFEDEDDPLQSIMPLQLACLAPGDRLLVASAAYQWLDGSEDPLDGLVLAADSVSFNLIEALGEGT
jgi:hypothetical protein